MISADKSQEFMRNSRRFQQNYGIFTNRNNNWFQSIKIKFTRKHLNLFNAYGGTFQIGELVLLLLLLSIHSSLSKGSLSHLSLYPLFFVTYLFLSHLSLYHLSLVPHLSQTSLSFSVSAYLSQHFSVNFIFWAMVINPSECFIYPTWLWHSHDSPWDNSPCWNDHGTMAPWHQNDFAEAYAASMHWALTQNLGGIVWRVELCDWGSSPEVKTVAAWETMRGNVL